MVHFLTLARKNRDTATMESVARSKCERKVMFADETKEDLVRNVGFTCRDCKKREFNSTKRFVFSYVDGRGLKE